MSRVNCTFPFPLYSAKMGAYITGLTQNPNLFRQSSLIRANLFKIREDWRILADEKIILRKSYTI